MDKEKMSEVMLEELREIVTRSSIPDGALTFSQLYELLEIKGEQKARRAVRQLVADGKWATKRKGQGYFYWRVDEV